MIHRMFYWHLLLRSSLKNKADTPVVDVAVRVSSDTSLTYWNCRYNQGISIEQCGRFGRDIPAEVLEQKFLFLCQRFRCFCCCFRHDFAGCDRREVTETDYVAYYVTECETYRFCTFSCTRRVEVRTSQTCHKNFHMLHVHLARIYTVSVFILGYIY